jgi:hypothetical protein
MLAINIYYLYLLRRLILRPRELTLGRVTRVGNTGLALPLALPAELPTRF